MEITSVFPAKPLPQIVKVEEFARRPGVNLQLDDPALTAGSTFMRGQFQRQELGAGLLLRSGDSEEFCGYTASATLPAGLSCMVFLRGEIEFRIGAQLHRFDSLAHSGIDILSVYSTKAQPIQRISRQPQAVRYLAINATPAWLAQRVGNSVSSTLLASGSRLSHRQRRVTEDIFRLQKSAPLGNPLLLEAKVSEILASSWDALVPEGSNLPEHSLPVDPSPREIQCLQRARDTIQQNLSTPLSVNQIARAAGISASGLQRLFHRFEGVSVMEFTRRQRLKKALEALRTQALSVQEAGALAGYGNAANFATAFKKYFGFSPREAKSRDKGFRDKG